MQAARDFSPRTWQPCSHLRHSWAATNRRRAAMNSRDASVNSASVNDQTAAENESTPPPAECPSSPKCSEAWTSSRRYLRALSRIALRVVSSSGM
eukprot:2275425-Rhodomonas_salina.2